MHEGVGDAAQPGARQPSATVGRHHHQVDLTGVRIASEGTGDATVVVEVRARDPKLPRRSEIVADALVVGVPGQEVSALVDVLLDNAFSHTAEGAGVRLSVAPWSGGAVIRVEDAGAGLPADLDVTARGVSGAGSTGLGLAIARRTAEESGGELVLGRSDLGGALVEARLGGQKEELERSQNSLLLALGLAIFFVYVVMASQFESIVQPLLIMASVPLAIVGIVAMLLATDTDVSVVDWADGSCTASVQNGDPDALREAALAMAATFGLTMYPGLEQQAGQGGVQRLYCSAGDDPPYGLAIISPGPAGGRNAIVATFFRSDSLCLPVDAEDAASPT